MSSSMRSETCLIASNSSIKSSIFDNIHWMLVFKIFFSFFVIINWLCFNLYLRLWFTLGLFKFSEFLLPWSFSLPLFASSPRFSFSFNTAFFLLFLQLSFKSFFFFFLFNFFKKFNSFAYLFFLFTCFFLNSLNSSMSFCFCCFATFKLIFSTHHHANSNFTLKALVNRSILLLNFVKSLSCTSIWLGTCYWRWLSQR